MWSKYQRKSAHSATTIVKITSVYLVVNLIPLVYTESIRRIAQNAKSAKIANVVFSLIINKTSVVRVPT